MKTKLTLAVVLILTLLATMAMAQGGVDRPNANRAAGIEAQGNDLGIEGLRLGASELNLTPEQKQQILLIREQLHKDIAEIINNTQPGEARRAAISAKAEAAINAVLSVLNAEQREKVLRLAIAQRFLKAPNNKPGIGRGLGFWDLLTPAQREQINAVLQTAKREIMQVRRDATLSPEVKQQRIAAIKKVAYDKILAILTPEQKTQMQQQGIKAESLLQGIDSEAPPKVIKNREGVNAPARVKPLAPKRAGAGRAPLGAGKF